MKTKAQKEMTEKFGEAIREAIKDTISDIACDTIIHKLVADACVEILCSNYSILPGDEPGSVLVFYQGDYYQKGRDERERQIQITIKEMLEYILIADDMYYPDHGPKKYMIETALAFEEAAIALRKRASELPDDEEQ